MDNYNKKNKMSIDVLNKFIYKTNDINLLIKEVYYEEMYNTIYDYYLKKIKNDDHLDKFLHIAFMIYKSHNKLNNALKLTECDIDITLMEFIIEKIYNMFSNATELNLISKLEFLNKLKERTEFNYTVINNLKTKNLRLEDK